MRLISGLAIYMQVIAQIYPSVLLSVYEGCGLAVKINAEK